MQKNHKPLVTIIQTAYNEEKYVAESIKGMLVQSFMDFEYIIVDDGSTDKTLSILREFSKKDQRIKLIEQDNAGLVPSLRRAISVSKGRYLARQDSDDISLKDRLLKQVELLDSTGSVLCGTSTEIINESGEHISNKILVNDDALLKLSLYASNPFVHSSVMFRKDAYEKTTGYQDIGPAEDLQLWHKLSSFGTFSAVEDVQVKWRVNSSGISSNNSDTQEALKESLIKQRWDNSLPSYLNVQEIRRLSLNADISSVNIEELLATIALKAIRYRHIGLGMKQITSLLLSGKSGRKAMFKKISLLNLNSATLRKITT